MPQRFRSRHLALVLNALALLPACSSELPSASSDGGAMADAPSGDMSSPLVDMAGRDMAASDMAAADMAAADMAPMADGAASDGPIGTMYAATGTLLGHVGAGLDEVSGIAVSRAHPGVYWVHNDSGDTPRFFAINDEGETLATISVSGATSEDWEDMVITGGEGGDVLYLANTGDNEARETSGESGRAYVQLYRVAEPDPTAGDATIEAERFDFEYPERPYDCESVFVDHATGDVYFVTKEATPAEVFVARAPLTNAERTTLEHVGTVNEAIATAADQSRDGTRIVIRGYATVHVYVRAADESPIDSLMRGEFVSAPPSAAAEAIAFEANGYGLYTVPEGAEAPLYFIPWE